MVGEAAAQVDNAVMIAWHQKNRANKGLEQLAQVQILGLAPEITKIASNDHGAWRLGTSKDGINCATQIGCGVKPAIGPAPGFADV
jgi:hypothetical protein